MSILPLTIAFLLLFAYSSHSYLLAVKNIAWEESSFLGWSRADRSARNVALRKQFPQSPQSLKGEMPGGVPAVPTPPQQPHKAPSRDKKNAREISKLNLYPLIHEAVPQPLLYDVALQLLRLLYQHRPCFAAQSEHRLLDAMIAKGKAHPEVQTVEELYPEEEELQPLFYKLARGTNEYELATSEGIPPIRNFFSLKKELRRRPINFVFASTPLIQALFGPEISTFILQHPRLSKQQLEEEILRSHPTFAQRWDGLKELMAWTPKDPYAKEIAVLDAKSHVMVRRRHPSGLDGQQNSKGAPLPDDGSHGNGASVPLDYGLHKGQT